MKKKKIPGPSYKRRSGIYKITCILTTDLYIGKSKNLHQRFCQHDFDLRRSKHPNPHLQELSDKFGVGTIVMETIELVDDEDTLETREVYWINLLKPNLNVVDTKLSATDVAKIRLMIDSEFPEHIVAGEFNISVKYLREIINGNKWRKYDT